MSNIYPCDTMLAWILAMARSVSVTSQSSVERDGRIRYDTRCYFNVCSKADMSQLNLPHGDDN